MVYFILGFFLLSLSFYLMPVDENFTSKINSSSIANLLNSIAILGAGVFTAILKSFQFTELFQKNISEVFFSPNKALESSDIKNRWLSLSQNILEHSLPSEYNAANFVYDRFFSRPRTINFKNYLIIYDIEDQGNGIVKIRATTRFDIIVSDNLQPSDHILKQSVFSKDNNFTIISININNHPIKFDKCLEKSSSSDDPHVCKIDLSSNLLSDKTASVERIYEYTQDLANEPYFIGQLDRYVKGMTIKAKAPNHNLYFSSTGLGLSVSSTKKTQQTDGEGYTVWQVAESQDLLLPGNGYILIVTKK